MITLVASETTTPDRCVVGSACLPAALLRMAGVAHELPDLVAAARDGSEPAWNEIVDRFAGLVWHVIRGFRLTDATAEDVYQTTWLRLAEHLDRIRQPESVGAWLARTAKNECLRSVRKAQREHPRDDLELDLVEPASGIGDAIEDATRDDILWEAFSRLSEPCQRLLRLLMTDPPLPYELISEQLCIAVGSIGPTRGRCLAKLRASRGVHLLEND